MQYLDLNLSSFSIDHTKTLYSPQPYFCSYVHNIPNINLESNVGNSANRSQIMELFNKHNIPTNTDILYATYMNRMATNFDNTVKQTDCAAGHIQCTTSR